MPRIHVLGPSGAGVSTLGRGLSQALGVPVFDIDDYFWAKTEPPFTKPNPVEERHRLLQRDIGSDWILAGSMDSWSEPYQARFELVVYLYAPAEVRIKRLRIRENERYGARIAPGGDLHRLHEEFLEWAAQYEQGRLPGRNKARHEAWMARLACPVLRIEGDFCPEEVLLRTLAEYARLTAMS